MPAPKEFKSKPKPSLIPMDILIKYLCPAYEEGLIRYYRESWRLGFKTTDMYDATIRHLEKYVYQQENWDPDAEKLGIKKHHLAGALFSIICMLDTFENHPELDDRGKDWQKGIEEENVPIKPTTKSNKIFGEEHVYPETNKKQDWKKEIEEENEEIVGFQSKIHPSFSFTTEDLINDAELILQETNQLKSCDLKTESSETLEIKNES